MNSIVEIRPFIFKAYYDWVVASGFSPYIQVKYESGKFPAWLDKYTVSNEMKEIHFNISPTACINLQVDEGGVSFSARFSGVSKEIFFPLGNLISIFVPSTGLTFPMGVSIEPHHVVPYFINLKRNLETPTVAEPVKVSNKPTLTVVK